MFVTLAEHEAMALNVPTFPIVKVPHPLASLPRERITEIGAGLADEVRGFLTDDAGGWRVNADLVEVDGSVEGFTAHAQEQGWGDGFPLIPPTPERVEAHLAYCPGDADASVGSVPPANREATYRVIAANTVMAGCRPEY